jgi:hypothetical protein
MRFISAFAGLLIGFFAGNWAATLKDLAYTNAALYHVDPAPLGTDWLTVDVDGRSFVYLFQTFPPKAVKVQEHWPGQRYAATIGSFMGSVFLYDIRSTTLGEEEVWKEAFGSESSQLTFPSTP